MDKTKVKVVIPIYTQTLTGRHLHSFQNNIKVFAAYPIVLLAPEGLDIEAITSLAPQAEVMRVSKDWLGEKGIAGYNNIMLSKSFYQLFADLSPELLAASYKVTLLFPLVSMLFVWLAMRAIFRDEMLVKAADRIR